MASNPEKLIPMPLGGQPEEAREIQKNAEKEGIDQAEKEQLLQEASRVRHEAFSNAPDLDFLLRQELKEQGKETPPGVNLALEAINNFRRIAKEAQDLRKVVKAAQDPKEKVLAAKLYAGKKKELEQYLAYGPSFKKAYREYIRAERPYFEFRRTLAAMRGLEAALHSPAFQSAVEYTYERQQGERKGEKKVVKLDPATYARLEAIIQQVEIPAEKQTDSEKKDSLESLATVYPKGSKEYKELAALLTAKEEVLLPSTKRALSKDIEQARQKAQELWEDPMVRYFWHVSELDQLLHTFSRGEDVVETQSVIRMLNLLNEWETEHQRTTIGGVLVGPPGVGKTTLVHHYLEERGRNYVYIDLSEDVTRYLLYGAKSLEFKSPVEYFKTLAQDLGELDEGNFRKFILEHSRVLKEAFGLGGEEAQVALIAQLEEELKKEAALPPKLESQLDDLKGRVSGLAQGAFRKELAREFAQVVKKNGWRDGVVIAALRRGDGIIFDEFNKNKNWSLIYGLMTAKPDEKWYFADNDEWIDIPSHWRMYFTANIGRKHGGFEVAEALASRAGGKVLEVPYPSSKEEMSVALVALSNPDGNFLRSRDDLAKLYVLVYEVFPKIRDFIADKRQAIPVSFRTIRDLGEKLVLYRDPKSERPLYQSTSKSFDEALYEILVESYALYEDKTIPKEIVSLCTSVGLLLGDEVKERVMHWIDKDAYEAAKKSHEEHKEDFAEIVKKIRGESRESMATSLPTSKAF